MANWRMVALGSVAALLAAGALACSDSGEDYAGLIPPPTERVIEITGFEIKGSTSASELAPPEVDPAQLGNGYGFKDVGVYESDSDKWQVASYIWGPSELIAYEDDVLNLHFFIINGNKHEVWIEGPNGETAVDEIEMNRGREYNIRFVANQAGVYRLICNEHEPSMTAEIIVLPRGGGS